MTEAPTRVEPGSTNDELRRFDISMEEWREYDFGGRVYRINKPQVVAFRPGGSTHRVQDSEGVVHCIPAPGVDGCVLRWPGEISF